MPTKKPKSGKRVAGLATLTQKYYADLADLSRQKVMFEMGTRFAFHALMHGEGKRHGWTLIAEQEKKVNGKTIRPDGTFKDQLNLVRGYWEAKDTADKLDAEIEKKRKAGNPPSMSQSSRPSASSPASIQRASAIAVHIATRRSVPERAAGAQTTIFPEYLQLA